MQVKPEELTPILVAHGIGVDVNEGKTTSRVRLDKLGNAIGYMLDNEVHGHGMVKDMALLIARMAHRLRETDDGLAIKAMAYLVRRDLVTSEQVETIARDAITGECRSESEPRERRSKGLRIPELANMTTEQFNRQLDSTTRKAPR